MKAHPNAIHVTINGRGEEYTWDVIVMSTDDRRHVVCHWTRQDDPTVVRYEIDGSWITETEYQLIIANN